MSCTHSLEWSPWGSTLYNLFYELFLVEECITLYDMFYELYLVEDFMGFTWWKRAIFSLTKKVSGTQISLMYSAPTYKIYSTKYPTILMMLFSLLVFTLLFLLILLIILLLLLLLILTISLSRSGCFSKVSLGSTHVCNYIHVFHMTFVIKVMIM